MRLRCDGNKVHGETVATCFGILEVYCNSRWCGKRADNVVTHRFNLATGEVTTRLYKKPTQSSPMEVNNAQ